MAARVVVVGGGYGGATLAKRLDDVADVVLVEPKDAFVHASAALRAVVDPEWQARVFYPYDGLLKRGRVVQDWARRVSPHRVQISPFESIDADVVVLATGTAYPFPAKFLENEADVASARLARMRDDLARCDRVLLVGGGPVGLELAGELTAAFRHLRVTVVDIADDVLTSGDFLPELRATIREQLEERGVEFVTGAPLAFLPPVDVGTYAPFTVETTTRVPLEAQMWFRCYGSRAQTGYLDEELAAARRPDGRLRVTEHLTVVGQDRVFAIGDITDVPESKRASAAIAHADVVARNVMDVLEGRRPSARYHAAAELIVLPLGPDGGASQLELDGGRREVVGPAETSRIKGRDLFSTDVAELFGRA
ncbi:MAG: FAD-dependent oxidoreductase [Actinomycetales bacterium]|jgi:NADH dehydrogenase FAD-containing subunit|nr:FAD-dependent oxidoreductase [Actinomycetales bacterium]